MRSRFTLAAGAFALGLVCGFGVEVGAKIAASTITATQMAANSITSTQIAAGAVTAGKIAANAVTATEIAAGAVTATKLSVSQLSAIAADLGAVTAGTINISGGSDSFSVSSSGRLDTYYHESDYLLANVQVLTDFLQVDGNLTMTARAGSGTDFACFDSNGTLQRSNTAC